jgi:hypothetical protein
MYRYLKGGDNGEIKLEEKRCQLPNSGPATYCMYHLAEFQKTSANLYSIPKPNLEDP